MKTYSRKIFYYETDRMSIVHNSNYLRIFEEARIDHLRQSGIEYFDIEQAGIIVPQTEAHVRYNHVLQYGDTINVQVKLAKFNGVVMRYEYEIFKNDETTPAASGYTCHCFLDDIKRLPVNLKKRMPEEYEKILVEAER